MLEATAKSGCSYVWRSIIGSKEALEAGLSWKIGGGNRIKVYSDVWVGGSGVRRLTGVEGTVQQERTVDQLLRENGEWDDEMLERLFHTYERDVIRATERKVFRVADERWWALEPKGNFTVRSCYRAQVGFYKTHDYTSDEDRKLWSRLVWQVLIPPKIRVFLWRACINVIPTMGNLREHHVPVEGICLLCRDRWASTEHVLLWCPRIRGIWKNSSFWRFLKRGRDVGFMVFASYMAGELDGDDYAVWCIMVWKIWSYICEITYGERTPGGQPREEECRRYWEMYQKARILVNEEMKLGVVCGERKWMRPRPVSINIEALCSL